MVDLLKASDKEIINMLLQDGLLTSWEGKLCPRCGEGTLSKAKIDVGGVPKHRCNRFRCQVYINPHHLHPLFTDGNGSGSTSLRIQAALLLLKLNKVSHPVIHRLLGINHKSIELMEKKLCDLRKRWVEHQEKGINFGGGPKWCDVEADETTFDRKDLKALAPDKNLPIVWEQWCGIVKRGDPKSLVLKRLVPRMSEKRAPGPGAIRKVERAPLAKTYLQDKQVILHTDAAKTYKMHIPGVVHDNVIHAKKRVKINGKWRWQNPSYVRIVTHKVPGVKKPIKCKAGSRSLTKLGSFWRIASLLTRIAKLVLQLSVPSWGPTFGWQPLCSAPEKWSSSSSVPEMSSHRHLCQKHCCLPYTFTWAVFKQKELGDNHQKPPVHSMFEHWSFINVFRKTTC